MSEITSEEDAVQKANEYLERWTSYNRSDAEVKHVSTNVAGGHGISSCRVHFKCGSDSEEVTVAMDGDGEFLPNQAFNIEP
jgi:hypothetical protein